MECELDVAPRLRTFSRINTANNSLEKPQYYFRGRMHPGSFRPIIIAIEDTDDASVLSYALKGAGIRNPIGWFRDSNAVITYLDATQLDGHFGFCDIPLLLAVDTSLFAGAAANTVKWIRQQPKYDKLLIVAITGTDNHEEIRPVYEAGANWHLAKSIEFNDLMRFVRHLREFWSYAVKPDFYEQLAAL
jgi:CheY-like chemotaxis protein